jgi:hypothetical protein
METDRFSRRLAVAGAGPAVREGGMSNDHREDFHLKVAHILRLPTQDPHVLRLTQAAEDTYGRVIRDLAQHVEHQQRLAARYRDQLLKRTPEGLHSGREIESEAP